MYTGGAYSISLPQRQKNVDKDCFGRRDPEPIQSRYILTSLEGSELQWTRVYFRDFASRLPGIRKIFRRSAKDSPLPLGIEPLLYRGWAFQERLLAPSVLHYGKEQVWWECHELLANGTYPDGVPYSQAKSLGVGRPAGAQLLQIPRKTNYFE